jgi:hypothetical protein
MPIRPDATNHNTDRTRCYDPDSLSSDPDRLYTDPISSGSRVLIPKIGKNL